MPVPRSVTMEKQQMHYYTAYSLTIGSTFQIPELHPSSSTESPDVLIDFGPVGTDRGESFSYPARFLLDIDEVAFYLIEEGRSITIQPYKAVSMKEIRLYLLGSVMGILMHQKGILPLHGSAILYHHHAIIFCGASGAGKSTLAARFIQKGFQILADDVSVITRNSSGNPIVHPGYPLLKLWTDSILKLGPKSFPRVNNPYKARKHSVPLSSEFSPFPVKLAGIYIIRQKPSVKFRVVHPNSGDKIKHLRNNIYPDHLSEQIPMQPMASQLLNLITEQCFIRLIDRPTQGFQLDKLIQLIEYDLELMSN